MSDNDEVARILHGIADLLDLAGEKFKPEAYRRAARSILSLPESIRLAYERGELNEIPGVGEAIAEKIAEFLKTGHVAYFENLQKQFPPGILELMQLSGIGPKTARRFFTELGVEGPRELSDAIQAGRLSGLKGFGPKKIDQFRLALGQEAISGKRTPLRQAYAIVLELIEKIHSASTIDQGEVAGSFRRRRETVGDLDLLVTSTTPEKVMAGFVGLPEIKEVKLQGPTRATVVYGTGIQVDLRVEAPAAFGAALLYFTGNKDHNIHLRTLARQRGLKINEYGVFRSTERIAGATEKDVYATLSLPWIPPEIRENQGEIEAAEKGRLPHLVEIDDLQGDLHVHVAPSATEDEVDDWVNWARDRRFRYLGLVLPVSKGSKSAPSPILRRIALFRAAPATSGPRVLLGEERTTIRKPSRSSTGPGTPDYWIWNVSKVVPKDLPKTLGGDPPLALAHFRSDSAAPAAARLEGWIQTAKAYGTALDLSSEGPQDGLDSSGARRAHTSGVSILVSAGSDAKAPGARELAVGLARRGWTPPSAVVNAQPLSKLPTTQRS